MIAALLAAFAPTALAARPAYDLVVYGATPQGITTAATAAREGLDVLLAEPGPQAGGVLTRGWLATLDVTTDDTGTVLHGGRFRRFFRDLKHDNSFDVDTANANLERLLPPEVDVHYRTSLTKVAQQAGRVTNVGFTSPTGTPWSARTRYLVDATDTAEAAARAGARFTMGRADTGIDDEQMASTLVFRLSDVDWEALRAEIAREHQTLRNGAEVRGRSVVGLWPVAKGYRPSDPRRFRLRGLNAARQDDGSLLVNALLIFGVDGTDPTSIHRAWQEGREESRRVTEYLRHTLPSVFGRAKLTGVAPELYVRESRHLVGLTRLRADDVLYGRTFPDGVALGGYPMDGQAYLPHETPYLLGKPAPYEVPLRTLVPEGLRNMLVVSQAASFDSAAAFSARVAPLQMNLGEAAGLAVAVAHRRNLDVPALVTQPAALAEVRNEVRGAGLIGAARVKRLPCRDEQHPNFGVSVQLLRRALFTTPYYYVGCLHLAEPQQPQDFLVDVEHMMGRAGSDRRGELDALRAQLAVPRGFLSSTSARTALRTLLPALPGTQLVSDVPRLDRGRAAVLRWNAMQGPPVAHVPDEERQPDS